MKRAYFISLVLICVIAASSVIFTKALCEDEDPVFDTLCYSSDFSRYDELTANALSQTGLLYEHSNDTLSLQPIILYLERQEKSPPVSPIISPVF